MMDRGHVWSFSRNHFNDPLEACAITGGLDQDVIPNLTFNEVTDESEHIRMQTVTEITGGDQGSNGMISVTVLVSVNRLFNYEFIEQYTSVTILILLM